MALNYKKLSNIKKINLLKNKQKNLKTQICFYFSYNHINNSIINKIKKDLMLLNGQLSMLKLSLISTFDDQIPIKKGNLLLINTNKENITNVYKYINKLKNLELLLIKHENTNISKVKFEGLVSTPPIFFQLNFPIINLLKVLNKVKLANIT